MRGREIDISLSDMKDWTPLERRSDTMKVTALHTGEIVLGAELRRCISNKLNDKGMNVKIYATDDMKVLAIRPDFQSKFKYPKNGRRNFKEYVGNLKLKGYKIPAVYNVEWNEQLQSWVGILQEVAERPQLIKGRKSGK